MGLTGTCLGVALMIEAGLGLDSWNAVMAGLDMRTSISLGMWSIVIQGSFWIIASILEKRMELRCIFPIVWKGLLIEICGFTVMLLVSGPFGTGTVIITFTVGYFVSVTKRAAEKCLLKEV